jgi:hypothetical protein
VEAGVWYDHLIRIAGAGAGLGAAFYYLYGPLLVWSRASWASRARAACVPIEDVPPEGRQYFEASEPALGRLGFGPATYVRVDAPWANTVVAMRVNRALGQVCLQSVAHDGRGRTPPHTTFGVDCDGRLSVLTTNGDDPSPFRNALGLREVSAAGVDDLDVLYRAHLVHERERGIDVVRVVPAAGAEARAMEAAYDWQMRRLLRAKLIRVVAGEYQPTMLGAFTLTWGGKVPFRRLRRWLNRREARKLVAAARAEALPPPPRAAGTREDPFTDASRGGPMASPRDEDATRAFDAPDMTG